MRKHMASILNRKIYVKLDYPVKPIPGRVVIDEKSDTPGLLKDVWKKFGWSKNG
jgi:hypothetical protein